jgi:hypothetical protein
MPTFTSTTVHGLSADLYFGTAGTPTAHRTVGDITISVTQEQLPLTANDEGMVNPIQNLRRGEVVTVTAPLGDSTRVETLSGLIYPFASGSTTSGGVPVVGLPKSVPGDDYLSKAQELRLVLRDGSSTWVFPSGVITELAELALSEENQNVYAATFTCYNATLTLSGGLSGTVSPFFILSGSHPTGTFQAS